MNYTVCITGTTRGIGLELAKQYAEAGWEVLACSRRPEAAPLQALNDIYPNLSIVELDVCNLQQIQQLANHLHNKPIDLLINSAGIFGKKEEDEDSDQAFETVNPETMQNVFMTNAIAPLMVARSLLNNLIESQLKTVVTITSRAGSIGDNLSGGMYAYRASKAAVNMVMKGFAVDLHAQQIKVLLLHPGWVKTDMGGPDALIDAETSVKGMRQVIDRKIKEPITNTQNLFFNYQGEELPW